MDLLRKARKAAAAAGMPVGQGGKDLKYFTSTKKGEQNVAMAFVVPNSALYGSNASFSMLLHVSRRFMGRARTRCASGERNRVADVILYFG